MPEMLTEQEIEELLNDVSAVYQSNPTCPKCEIKTKRVLVKQKYSQTTFIEVINEQDNRIYSGKIVKNLCICLRCGGSYMS